ncbi:hypothetical protein AVEN_273957-1 [Araneus ventricosus]|uniref:Uncharacterized protein n=1 Tax=Araneus ventricosus TaxID=182803 RepID=A0A4Y2W3K8_ARAVE|nr:hypothetical protein AVEN_27572-1 [Araneus ventricosus]GBO31571.1 hypothetical protein AVEN_273957-1 [Araneus ventricosus]
MGGPAPRSPLWRHPCIKVTLKPVHSPLECAGAKYLSGSFRPERNGSFLAPYFTPFPTCFPELLPPRDRSLWSAEGNGSFLFPRVKSYKEPDPSDSEKLNTFHQGGERQRVKRNGFFPTRGSGTHSLCFHLGGRHSRFIGFVESESGEERPTGARLEGRMGLFKKKFF